VNGDEECEDGNTVNGDTCDNNCRIVVQPAEPIVCGDGKVEGTEKCDPGKYCENLIKSCTTDSDCNGVGDGKCQTRDNVLKDGYICSADCKTRTAYQASCGNGIQDNGEVCDGG
jgi:hypothetical protein